MPRFLYTVEIAIDAEDSATAWIVAQQMKIAISHITGGTEAPRSLRSQLEKAKAEFTVQPKEGT